MQRFIAYDHIVQFVDECCNFCSWLQKAMMSLVFAVNMFDISGRGCFPPWRLMMWQPGVMWELQSPFVILRDCRQSLSIEVLRLWKDRSSKPTLDVGEVLAACEAESTRSSASQAVTRQDKKSRRAPSLQKICLKSVFPIQ